MDGLIWIFKKFGHLKDIFVIGGIGFIGFGIAEGVIGIIWGIVWLTTGLDTEETTRKMNGHQPGNIMGQWWDATKGAWNHLWGIGDH